MVQHFFRAFVSGRSLICVFTLLVLSGILSTEIGFGVWKYAAQSKVASSLTEGTGLDQSRSTSGQAKDVNVEKRLPSDVILVTYMRSGSTFLGQMLGHRNDSFYWYEPLWVGNVWTFYREDGKVCNYAKPECQQDAKKSTQSLEDSLRFLSDIYNCSLRNHASRLWSQMHSSSWAAGFVKDGIADACNYVNIDGPDIIAWTVTDQVSRCNQANRVDPDETAPTGAVSSGSTLFANTSNHVTMRKLEREMKMGLVTSRRTMIEREKAMEAARNPGFSKFGESLVNINSKTDKALTCNMRKINAEIRRMEAQLKHKMRYFVKTSAVMNHDPLILVERPPSPDVIKRAHTMTSYNPIVDDYPPLGDEHKPGYMRSIRSKAKTPSTLTTIDVFAVKSRNKRNVWEDAAFDKSQLEFQSTIRPYAKLTKREITDLQRGYDFHKPKLEQFEADADETRSSGKRTPKKKAIKIREVSDDSGDSDLDELTPFITQMAEVRRKKSKPKDHKLAKIRVKSTSPILAIAEANSPENKDIVAGKNVRFSSPVVLSAPGRRKPKTAATEVTY